MFYVKRLAFKPPVFDLDHVSIIRVSDRFTDSPEALAKIYQSLIANKLLLNECLI